MNNKYRPIYLDVFRIHMPVTAVVSILHRVAGVLLFLSIPFFIYMFQLSLRDAPGFDAAQELLHHTYIRVFGAVLCWALLHHFFAGLRFLLTDLRIGLNRSVARVAAWTVFGCELVAVMIALWVWS